MYDAHKGRPPAATPTAKATGHTLIAAKATGTRTSIAFAPRFSFFSVLFSSLGGSQRYMQTHFVICFWPKTFSDIMMFLNEDHEMLTHFCAILCRARARDHLRSLLANGYRVKVMSGTDKELAASCSEVDAHWWNSTNVHLTIFLLKRIVNNLSSIRSYVSVNVSSLSPLRRALSPRRECSSYFRMTLKANECATQRL